MERLTARKHDIVLLRKDGQLIPPMNMSGQEIRMVMERLCEYEDEAEQREKGCGGYEGAEDSFLIRRFMRVE